MLTREPDVVKQDIRLIPCRIPRGRWGWGRISILFDPLWVNSGYFIITIGRPKFQ
jgi:hypothetical protein